MFMDCYSPIGELVVYFHDYLMEWMVMILVVSMGMFFFVMSSMYYDMEFVEHEMMEFVWTVVPMVVLVFMAGPSVFLLYLTEDVGSSGLMVKVIGHQWYWEYEYSCLGLESFDSYLSKDSEGMPNYHGFSTDTCVVVPIKTSVSFMVSSSDVIHAWTVPSLGMKIDAVPGRINMVSFSSSFSGVWFGQCSEICGVNHSFMPINVALIDSTSFMSMV